MIGITGNSLNYLQDSPTRIFAARGVGSGLSTSRSTFLQRDEDRPIIPELPGRTSTSETENEGRGIRSGGLNGALIDLGTQTAAQASASAPASGSADRSPAQEALEESEETSESESTGPNDLTEEEEAVVRELQQRDAEVRRHEQAHAAVGGQYASAPTYTFQRGPDGQLYAIGGEVQIDSAPVEGDPEATIQKLTIVVRAALAPAEPSAQDRNVAAQAQAGIQAAQAELSRQQAEEREALANGEDPDSAGEADLTVDAPEGSGAENGNATSGFQQSATVDNSSGDGGSAESGFGTFGFSPFGDSRGDSNAGAPFPNPFRTVANDSSRREETAIRIIDIAV